MVTSENSNLNTDSSTIPRLQLEPEAESKAELATDSATAAAVAVATPLSTQDEVIINGSTWAAIWHMSWPLFLNMATIAVASFADVWVSGQLGPHAQAAIGLGGQIWFFMVLLAVALSAGTNALVSRFWGEGDLNKTIEAARQSILFAVGFGLVSSIIGLISCRPLLHMLGASAAVEQLGWDYLKFDLLAQFPFTVLWVTNSIFRAKGNPRVPMMIMALITLQVIILDLALCIWPFKLGISGIGLSWAIASVAGLSLSFYLLGKSTIGACLDVKLMLQQASPEWFGRLMRIGIPACVQDLSWVGGNFILFMILAKTKDPVSCQASWAIGARMEEMLGGFPIYALSMAVATIIGQNLGAKQPDRAEKIGWQVAATGAGFNLAVALILFFNAKPFASLMSHDAKVIEYSSQYLQIVGLSQPFVAIWLILSGAMNGAGYTKWTMWATLICLTGIRLPLAFYLTVILGYGPIGTWWALACTSTVVGSLLIWRFKTGVWKLQKV